MHSLKLIEGGAKDAAEGVAEAVGWILVAGVVILLALYVAAEGMRY